MNQSSAYENHNPSPPHFILCAHMKKKREEEGREGREEGERRDEGAGKKKRKREGEGREGEGQGW